MKYLIAGLGNPGPEYEVTRHNIGFLTLDQLADQFEETFNPDRHASYCSVKHKGRTLHLIKPTTFMNLSGKAINYWLQKLNLPKQQLLVVTDDTALPFGKIRLRPKGSDAGHNGLKSIEELLGNNEFARLRMGIGDDFPRGGKVDYVLGRFNDEEFQLLPEFIKNACDAILSMVTIGMERTMNHFN